MMLPIAIETEPPPLQLIYTLALSTSQEHRATVWEESHTTGQEVEEGGLDSQVRGQGVLLTPFL